jgi:hypothetical protein
VANLSEAWIGLGEEYLEGPPAQEAYTEARAVSTWHRLSVAA